MGEKLQVPRVLTPLCTSSIHAPEVLPTHLCFQDLDSSLPVFQDMAPRVWSHSVCAETEPSIDYHLIQRRGSQPGLQKGIHSGPLHLYSSISVSIQYQKPLPSDPGHHIDPLSTSRYLSLAQGIFTLLRVTRAPNPLLGKVPCA